MSTADSKTERDDKYDLYDIPGVFFIALIKLNLLIIS